MLSSKKLADPKSLVTVPEGGFADKSFSFKGNYPKSFSDIKLMADSGQIFFSLMDDIEKIRFSEMLIIEPPRDENGELHSGKEYEFPQLDVEKIDPITMRYTLTWKHHGVISRFDDMPSVIKIVEKDQNPVFVSLIWYKGSPSIFRDGIMMPIVEKRNYEKKAVQYLFQWNGIFVNDIADSAINDKKDPNFDYNLWKANEFLTPHYRWCYLRTNMPEILG